MTVVEAGQAGGRVRPEACLLQHADARAITHAGDHEVLEVERMEVGGVELVDTDRLAAGLELAVAGAVGPVGMAVADAPHAEGEALLQLDDDLTLGRVVEAQLGPADVAGARVELELVADGVALPHAVGAPGHRAGGDGVEHQRRLEPPLTGLVLVQRQVGEAVAEVQRGPQPERLGQLHRPVGLDLGTDRAHAPRAVAGAGDLARVDAHLGAVDRDGALPRAPLGEAGVVHGQQALGGDDALAGLLDGDGRVAEGEVAGDAVLVGLDDVADGAHRVDHLEADGPDGGGAVEGHGTRGEHRVLDAVEHDAEGGVDDATHRVVAHGGAEVEVAVLLVAVEPVAVVVVRVAGGGVGDGIGTRVDRVVVERAQHRSDVLGGSDEDLALGVAGQQVGEGRGHTVEADATRDEGGGVDVAGLEQRGRGGELALAVVDGEAQLELLEHAGERHDRVGRDAHTGDHDSAPHGRGVHGDLDEPGDAHALDHHVEVGGRWPLGRIVHAGGAEPVGGVTTGGRRVAHDDLCGTEAPGPGRDRGTDVAAADDEHAVAGADPAGGHGVEADGERLDQGPEVADVVTQADGGAGIDPHVLGEPTRRAADALRVEGLAVGGVVGQAPTAAAAGRERQRGEQLALAPPTRQVGAHGDDLAAELVAHHDAARHVTVGLEVGAADAAGLDPDHEVARARGGVGNLLHDEGVVVGQHGCAHVRSPRGVGRGGART